MKKTIILVLVFLLAGFFAYSQVKIGVVNSQEVLAKTKRGLDVQKKMQTFQQGKQGQLAKLQEDIARLEKEVASPALNATARSSKTVELQQKRKDLQRAYEDAQSEFNRKLQSELAKLEQELSPLVQEIGKTNGFTVILDIAQRGVAYFDSTVDITAEVIKAADAKYGK